MNADPDLRDSFSVFRRSRSDSVTDDRSGRLGTLAARVATWLVHACSEAASTTISTNVTNE
jgi:hypothetical protein